MQDTARTEEAREALSQTRRQLALLGITPAVAEVVAPDGSGAVRVTVTPGQTVRPGDIVAWAQPGTGTVTVALPPKADAPPAPGPGDTAEIVWPTLYGAVTRGTVVAVTPLDGPDGGMLVRLAAPAPVPTVAPPAGTAVRVRFDSGTGILPVPLETPTTGKMPVPLQNRPPTVRLIPQRKDRP